ncbi:MAG TPA: mandelate racemase/muconate lactonizing enzyme family protein [Trebonia sp.]
MSTITSVQTYTSESICVVRVRTDDGLEGWGQTAPSEPTISAEVLHRLVARHYLGQDPWDIAALADKCLRAEYKFLGSFLFRAISGLDTALWDWVGKATERPVYQLLGGRIRKRFPVYASSMSRETTPAEEIRRLAEAVEASGFRGVKYKIGIRNGREANALEPRTAELIPLVRRTLGDSVQISADANGAYSPAQAVQVGRVLEEYGYFHFEEPNPCWELDNMGYVARMLDIPVGAGEQEFSMEIIRRMLSERLVDIIQPDVCYIGGLSRAKRVAEMADIAGIPCTPHNSNRSLLQVFTAHLVSALPACSGYQEWSIEDQSRARNLYAPVPVVKDGEIELSDAPGWGIEVLPAFLENATLRESVAE